MMIDIAIGRACHFCADRDVHNYRVRRAHGARAPEELAVPLCSHHRLLLQGAGRAGRLHKATGTRWWLVGAEGEPATGAPPPTGCPAGALLEGMKEEG